jgi:hypothetical protein
MAKAKYGGGIQDLRGSIAGQVHSRNTYGNYIRQKVSPVQPRTARQLEVRELFSTLSRRYSTILTDEQQEAWRQAAASTPVRDVFGDSITLTGINLYNRLNSVRVLAGLPPLNWPPPVEEVEALETFTANWNPGDWDLSIEFTPSPVPSDRYLFIWTTEPLNPGIAFVTHKLRLLTILGPGTESPVSLTGAYIARYGGITPGKAVYVAGELASSLGWKGPRNLAKVRITGS